MSSVLHAQSTVTPEDEYKKLIRVSEDIQPLGATPFGDNVSLYNGSLSFDQTDISLAGNGPVLRLSRSFRTMETHPDNPVGGLSGESMDGGFSDWDIELPRITTLVGYHSINPGWQVQSSTPYARCSHFSAPATIAGWQGNADWEPHSWWAGYQLIVPGAGSQDLLVRGPHNTLAPNAGVAAYPIVTTKNWVISCGVQTDDETNGGEGFIALAPDGTKYTLNHLVYRWAPTIDRPVGTGPNGLQGAQSMGMRPMLAPTDYLQRLKAEMLVTKVEDRFGNTLTYHYDPNNAGSLTSIAGSDGRQLTLAHSDGSQRVTAATLTDPARGQTRAWQYKYDETSGSFHRLENVILPDGSEWSFNLGILFANMTPDVVGTCDAAAQFNTKSWTGTITHPSGLVGSFTLAPLTRGRSYVLRQCVTPSPGSSYASIPRFYSLPAIVSKTFTGAGIASQTWNYSYSTPNASWTDDSCASSNSCASTVSTDVLDPDGHDVRYTFSNRYDYSESQLLTTDYHAGNAASPVVRSEANGYAMLPLLGIGLGACPDPSGWPWPWPCEYGSDLQSRTNHAQVQNVSPVTRRTISQDGDAYMWEAEAFDAYVQVAKTRRSNSISGQTPLEESTIFRNDTALWVLGLPLQVTNNTTGEVESTNTYTATNDTPLTRARFGQTLMRYEFNAAGQLASFTDGNSHTTTLGSYKRGIPQAIVYPDHTSESLVVDDFGQIASMTDQAGHTTGYSYDPVGRITGIAYPSGDEVAWNPKTFDYSFVTSAERGVPANHWKRTTTTGSAQSVTYFDALLRPVLSDSAIGGSLQSSTLVNYDAKGQPIFASYPSATALTFSVSPGVAGSRNTYDGLGRLTQVQQDSELGTLTSSTAYLSGARRQVTDPKGNVTTTSYQVFDSPSYDAVTKVVAPAGITQDITRDIYGNPTAIRQFGSYSGLSGDITKTLTYDSNHRLCATTEPESRSEVMGYDGANNLLWSVSGATLNADGSCPDLSQSAAAIKRSYDEMNRLTDLSPPAFTQSTHYAYDNVGNPTSVVSGISTWSGRYNFRGMLTTESLALDGQSPWRMDYVHDANGNLGATLYPDGESVTYAPDALGRPTQVGGYAHSVHYFANGQVKDFVFGNGTAYVADQCSTDQKNCRQLLSSFSYGLGTPQLSEEFGYDQNGNITAVNDLAGNQRNKTFGYDALNRLSSAQANGLGINETYTYDPLNNLRSRVTGGQTLTYNYDATNALTAVMQGASPIATFQYDIRGNVINKSGTNLLFDQKNQLTEIQGFGTYAYDAAGRRVKKTPSSGSPTDYFYSHAGQLMYQAEEATLNSTNFIYLGSKLIARNETNGTPVLSAPAVSGNGNYTVSWNGVGGANSYTLQEQSNGGGWSIIQTSGATSAGFSGKAEGTYSYRVKACKASGLCSPWSNVATTSVIYPPAAPASITIPTTSNGSVAVSWAASSTATSYTLQHADYGVTGWSTVYSGGSTAWTQQETVTGEWIYQVRACNAGGCSAYTVSNTRATVTIPPAGMPSLTVPSTSSSGSYTVSWSAVSAASSYTLQERVGSGGWATIQTSSALSKAISGKTNGSFGYQVRGCNAGGCGPWSSVSAVEVVLIPAAPTSIAITTSGPDWKPVFTLTWSTMPWATSYQVEEYASGDVIPFYSGPDTTASRLILEEGTVQFRAKACSSSGCSAWSGYVSQGGATTPPPGTAPALSVPASSITGNYAVSWSGVSGATSYTLQERVNNGAWGTVQTGGATSRAVTGKSSASYGYQVQACNSSGCGPWSATKTIAVGVIPAAPGTPSVYSSGPDYKPVVHVSWGAVSSATSYQLEETNADDGTNIVYGGSSTSWSQLILVNGIVKFRVRACTSAGCSAFSSYSTIVLNAGF